MLALGKRVGNAVRLAEVVQVLVRYGFEDLVERAGLKEGLPARLLRGLRSEAPPEQTAPQGHRIRAALTELGPTFVKFGQILSTRPDLVGKQIGEDLRELQDKVAPLPFETMEQVLDEELGDEARALFAELDPNPVASASLSQVYRARLASGEAVALKIQRPGIGVVIESDLSLMRAIAEWVAEHLEDVQWIDPVGLVDEFARSIRRELDFSIERRVIDHFRQDFKDFDDLFVPRTYGDLSAMRVLTMDWVDGVRVDALDQYPDRRCDPATVAATGCRILCQQVFEHQLFHADPHPGNIFIMRDNRIAFLDYGMVGHLERTDAAAMADLLRTMFREDAPDCVQSVLVLTTRDDVDDRQSFEHEIADFIAFEGQSIVGGGRVGDGIDRMIEILRRHHLQLAPRFSLLLKALATIEAVGHVLDPKMNMVPIIQPYVERLVLSRYSPGRMLSEMQQSALAFHRLFRQLPGDIQSVLGKLRQGQLRIQMTHERLDHVASVLDRASNRIAFGVITGSLIVGSSLLMTTAGHTQKLGLLGYSIAGVLGLALMISILRSKNY